MRLDEAALLLLEELPHCVYAGCGKIADARMVLDGSDYCEAHLDEAHRDAGVGEGDRDAFQHRWAAAARALQAALAAPAGAGRERDATLAGDVEALRRVVGMVDRFDIEHEKNVPRYIVWDARDGKAHYSDVLPAALRAAGLHDAADAVDRAVSRKE